MSMTREQAIKHIEDIRASALENLGAKYAYGCEGYYRTRIELSDICLTALRPVSREQIEKVWRGCEKCNGAGEYSRYAENLAKILLAKYCPHCGRPLTDEAVQMAMERLEALKNGAD